MTPAGRSEIPNNRLPNGLMASWGKICSHNLNRKKCPSCKRTGALVLGRGGGRRDSGIGRCGDREITHQGGIGDLRHAGQHPGSGTVRFLTQFLGLVWERKGLVGGGGVWDPLSEGRGGGRTPLYAL